MIGIPKREKLCCCGHLQRWHHDARIRGDYSDCLICQCPCNNSHIPLDNLRYVEYVESTRKLRKRLFVLLFDLPLSIAAKICRFKEDVNLPWTVFSFISAMVLIFIGIFVDAGYTSLIVKPRIKQQEKVDQAVWIAKSWVTCYSGDMPIYAGKIIGFNDTKPLVHITSWPDQKEYYCNGLTREERKDKHGH